MELDLYQVDAFSSQTFSGNPAAVCPLDNWLSDELMQKIAQENNLAETAFFVKEESGYYIRWFTPTKEVNLCGHATLATAFILFEKLGHSNHTIHFQCKSGALSVKKEHGLLQLNFPSQNPQLCETPQALIDAFGKAPLACFENEDYLAVYDDETFIKNVDPNMALLETLDLRGVIITSQSDQYDFINRVFAPKYGINEDPVTGSAFTKLIPYWAKELSKSTLKAKQVSKRGGEVNCELAHDRVLISGACTLYMVAKIYL